MSAQQQHSVWTAYLTGADDPPAVGYCLIPNAAGTKYIVASAANRTAASRTTAVAGIVIREGDVNSVEVQTVGPCPPEITLLGTGAAGPIIVDDNGRLARKPTPLTSDIVAGKCDADGWAYLNFSSRDGSDATGATPGGSAGDTQIHSPTDTLQGFDDGQPLEFFGAVGDGVTSDQTAFEAARSALADGTHDSLEIGADTYLVTGMADPSGNPFPFGVSIMGRGPKSVLKTDTNGPLIVFRSSDSAERAKATSLAYLSALGSGKTSGKTNQDAFRCGYLTGDGSSRIHAHNLYAKDMGGIGLIMAYTDKLGSGAVSTACRSESCDTGLVGTEGEAHGFQAIDCTIGVRVGSGNFCMIGGSFEGCTTGYRVNAGGNDAHGMCVGTSWTHNTTAIYLEASTNGQYFTGCRVFDGAITIVNGNSKFHTIGDCLISGTSLTLNGKARWLNVTFGTAYYTSSDFTGGENEFVNPRGEDGTIPSWIGQQYHCQVTYASNADKTLSTQQGWAEVVEILAGSESTTVNLINRRTPSRGEKQLVVNRTSQTIHYAWAGGDTGQDIPAGFTALIGFELAGANMVIYSLSDNTGSGGGGGGFSVTGTGLVKATSGTINGAASLLVDADVDAAAAIAGTKIDPDFGSQDVQTTGSVAAPIFKTDGTLPTTGTFRVKAGFSMVSSVSGVDRVFLQFDSGAQLLGGDASTTGNIIWRTASGTGHYHQINGVNFLTVLESMINTASSVGGDAGGAVPFRWRTAAISVSGDLTLSAAQAACVNINLAGSPGASYSVTAPDLEGATFNLRNGVLHDCTFKKSGGTGVTFGDTAKATRISVTHAGSSGGGSGDYEPLNAEVILP
jgi:hypothetical protein